MKLALITGATGFVGRHVASKFLAEGWQVHALVREASRLTVPGVTPHALTVDSSISEFTQVIKDVQPDVVLHLASLFLADHAPEDVGSLIRSNVEYGSKLLEGMRQAGVPFLVNAGTSWQHFHSDHYEPVCLYAATKQAFEDVLAYYTSATPMRAITLKLFDTYGADDPRKKLVKIILDAIKSKTLTDVSGGEQEVDFVHVDDAANAFFMAAERLIAGKVQRSEVYGVSSGEPLELKTLIEILRQHADGPDGLFRFGGRPYRTREVFHVWKNFQSLPGWKPERTLKQGLSQLVEKVLLD